MTLLALHHDRVSRPGEVGLPLPPVSCEVDLAPVVVGDWWCHECGRAEADDRTRLCPECAYRTRTRATWQVAAAVAAASVVSAAATVAALVVGRRRTRPRGSR
jgi:hypothetical protein